MFDELDTKLNQETDARTNKKVELVALQSPGLQGLNALRKRWSQLPMIPRVVHDRFEGIDNSWPGFDVRTVLVGEESAGRFTFHSVVLAPGAGLPDHHLFGADTHLCMLDGALDVKVGAKCEVLRRDAFCYVPENTTQSFRNTSSEPAYFFLWHSPAGAERAFAAAHELSLKNPRASQEAFQQILASFGFEFHRGDEQLDSDQLTNQSPPRLEARIDSFEDLASLRQSWTCRRATPKVVLDRKTVSDIPLKGQDTKVLLSGDEGSGRCVVFHYGLEPGYRAIAHHQPSEEEIFLVLEGTLELTAGNLTTQVSRGGFGFVPRYGTHAFFNPLQAETRTITINSPAGHERGFEMIVRDAGSDRFPELLVAHGWHIHEHYEPTA